MTLRGTADREAHVVVEIHFARLSCAALLLILATAPLPPLEAQTGSLSGVVVDSSGAGILGAQLSLGSLRTRTDERGEFYFAAVATRNVTLRVRRLGFLPDSVNLVLQDLPQGRVRIKLASAPTTLLPVVIKSTEPRYTGRLAGYYERLDRRVSGYFITRDQIDRENPRFLSQLLTHAPGISPSRMRGGGSSIRMRNRNCSPLVWLDGIPMGAGEVDLDAFVPSSLQGIELYLGSTTAPLKYIAPRDQSSCGTVLLWSRGPDTDPPVRNLRPRFDLESMMAATQVYTAEQVDRPVASDPSHQLSVDYPRAVFAAGGGGFVLAEFVVDAAGKVEDGTFGIVSSTDPLLSDAVKAAVQKATFKPAIRRGSAVRQIVMQPFAFPARERKNPRG